jgi:hypothetical protein
MPRGRPKNPDGPKKQKDNGNFRKKTSESRTIELVPFMDGSYRKSNAGRPQADLSSLPEGWQDSIIAMYSNGASDAEVKATIYMWRGSFSTDLWERWMKEEEEFSEIIKMGRVVAEAWYTKLGREQLVNSFFPYAGWYMQMKNRFGWRDKPEENHERDVPIQIEVIRKKRNIDHADDTD